MSCYCVASYSRWAYQQPFAGYSPPLVPGLAISFIGGLFPSRLTSITPHSRPESTNVLATFSPLGFLVLEAGFSYLQWLSIISDPYSKLIFHHTTTYEDNLRHFPVYLTLPQDPVFAFPKDLIIPPTKDIISLSPVSKDLALFDLSPACNWEYTRSDISEYGDQLLDSDGQLPLRRSARIATLSSEVTVTRAAWAPNAGSNRGRDRRLRNGSRRNGPPNEEDPAGGNSKIASLPTGRKRRTGGSAPPPPGPPSPPSTHTQEGDPDENSDGVDKGWVYLFLSLIIVLVSAICSIPKHQKPPTYYSEDTDLITIKPPVETPIFMKTSLTEVFLILFFLLYEPAVNKKSLDTDYEMPFLNYEFKQPTVPASAQTEEEATATANGDKDGLDSFAFDDEFAFCDDVELSNSTEDRDETSSHLNLSAICGPPVENDFQEVPVAAVDVPVRPSTFLSPFINRRPSTQNAVASSSKVIPVISRLFIPVSRDRRKFPNTITLFVQVDAPRENGFMHFDVPNFADFNNRFLHVDLCRRRESLLREQGVGGTARGSGVGDS